MIFIGISKSSERSSKLISFADALHLMLEFGMYNTGLISLIIVIVNIILKNQHKK